MIVDKHWLDEGDLICGDDHALAPCVFLIKVARQMMKNNNYLIVDPATHQAVLVDPAWQIDELHAALANTQSALRGILLTHAHPDHIDLARPLADFYNCPIWMSREEIAASRFSARQLVAIDETPFRVGEMRIEPILTPGHTPGCVCYLIGDHLFTGDVLFAEGCGICPNVDAAHAMFDSLQRLQSRLRPDTRIYPGHTYGKPPGQRFADVLSYNIYLHFRDKHSFANFRLRKGQSARKLLDFH